MNIAVSQRRIHFADRNEDCDCLDSRITLLLAACGMLCVPIPSVIEDIEQWLFTANIRGILLSGGNDLAFLGGENVSLLRDTLEHQLIDIAAKKNIPLFGICRGLQILAHHYGAGIVTVEGHVAVEHTVLGNFFSTALVNSYHKYGIMKNALPAILECVKFAPDGCVEAIKVREFSQMAIMWHPERNVPFVDEDIALMKSFFGVRKL